ncbi:hypothetical protein KKA13_02565 [Patescibacteria group bacterium]|nr:hypothetical protein [Patescibacteria group bacterium]
MVGRYEYHEGDKVYAKEEWPQHLREACELCGEVTEYSRAHFFDERIPALQKKANELSEILLIRQRQLDNAETDLDVRIGMLRSELENSYKEAIKNNLEEETERVSLTSMDLARDEANVLPLFDVYADKIPVGRIYPSEEFASLSEEELKRRGKECVKDLLKKGQTPQELRRLAVLFKNLGFLRTPHYANVINYIKFIELYIFTNTLKKRVQKAGTLEKIKEVERTKESFFLEAVRDPDYKNIIERQRVSFFSSTADTERDKMKEKALKSVGAMPTGRELVLVYDALSENEMVKKSQAGISGDYSDKIVVKIKKDKLGNFSLSCNELLGAAKFAREENFNPSFHLQEILSIIDLGGIVKKPLEADDGTKKTYKDYAHIDSEFRQLQAQINGVDKEHLRRFVELFFVLK